ncbi:Nse1 non-SMC component of SMC5-6 complex-domain-containing protein [Powellomyces hirtus]|nr:Nse1 non-SMC component of SMC5-6 complex-domain-containing protein [Powellomyces hirtus]
MVVPTTHKRLFLQGYLKQRFLPEDAVLDLLKKVCEHYETEYNEAALSSFLSEFNEMLDPYDMELRRGHAPDSGTTFYALVNTNGDEVAQVATCCTPAEIAYFKHLLEIIVTADDDVYEISSTVALSEASRIKPAMTKRDAEAFIERLIQAKWLVDRNGLISMSLRTVLELQNYLKEEYGDRIHECTLCMEIVTSDYERCSVANCQTRLHVHCSNSYFPRQAQKNCPSCQSPWRGILLGTGTGRSSGSARLRRPTASQATQNSVGSSAHIERDVSPDEGDEREEEAEDEEGEEEEGEEEIHTGSANATPRRNGRSSQSERTSTGKRRR